MAGGQLPRADREKLSWEQAVGAGLLVSGLAGWAAMEQYEERRKRKKKEVSPHDAVLSESLLAEESDHDSVWMDEELFGKDPFGLEELAHGLLDAISDEQDQRKLAWM